MLQRDYLIVRAGIAAGGAVEALRSLDKKGSVTVVGNESLPPYAKPKLLPTLLAKTEPAPDKLLHLPASWYDKNKVEVRTDAIVAQLNTERRIAVLSTGQAIEFKKALLAMGSRPRRPQVAGANLGQVLYLRGVRDFRALREIAATEKDIVVLGGGLIAMEVVSALRQMKRPVTMMSRYAYLWQNRLDLETATWLTDHFHAHGVNMLMQEALNGFEGKTVLRNIQTKSGQRFPASLAVVAIGAEPNLDLVANTPLSSPNGTPVNEFLETDEKGIFAAGDIALYPDKIFGGVRRVEHYQCALEQGRVAGTNITGKKRVRFEHTPHYSTKVFDLQFDIVGDVSRPPSRCDILEGDRHKKKFIAQYFQGNHVVGMVLVNQDPKRVAAMCEAMRSKHAK